MGVTVAVTRTTCTVDTAPYTQDITTADLGDLTPKAALLIATYATSDGSAADDAVLSFGACDAANEWAYGWTSEHGQGTTDTDLVPVTNACVAIRLPGDQADDGVAEFSSFITNGVRINWTNAPAAAYLLTVVFFAGTDLSVDVDTVGLGNTVDLETDITAPGFEPDVVICASSTYGYSTTNIFSSIGLVDWDGDSTITQRCIAFNDRDAQATSAASVSVWTDRGVCCVNSSGSVVDWYG